MNETYVTVQGRLVADPDHRVGRTGTPFTVFRVASTARRPARNGGFEDGSTNFFNVTAFRALGANAARSLKQGDPVIVTGRLKINQFVRADDSHGTSVDIDARSIGHDLLFGTTEFTKVVQPQYGDENDRLGAPEVRDALREVEQHGGPEQHDAEFDPATDEYVVAGATG
jgi:single-strand DNA-binding protein